LQLPSLFLTDERHTKKKCGKALSWESLESSV
jgi:hypothetical protein